MGLIPVPSKKNSREPAILIYFWSQHTQQKMEDCNFNTTVAATDVTGLEQKVHFTPKAEHLRRKFLVEDAEGRSMTFDQLLLQLLVLLKLLLVVKLMLLLLLLLKLML